MALGAGQTKGPFKPTPGLRFPVQAGAVGSVTHYVGSRRAARQGFGLSLFFLAGLQFIMAAGPLVCFDKAKLQQDKALLALMETGLSCTDGWKGCLCKGEDQDHPFPPELNKLLGKVSVPQGNVLL